MGMSYPTIRRRIVRALLGLPGRPEGDPGGPGLADQAGALDGRRGLMRHEMEKVGPAATKPPGPTITSRPASRSYAPDSMLPPTSGPASGRCA